MQLQLSFAQMSGVRWLLLFTSLELMCSEMDKWLASCKQDASLHQAPHHDKDEAY